MSTHILEPGAGRLCKACLYQINPGVVNTQCAKVYLAADPAAETVRLIQFAPSKDETCNLYKNRIIMNADEDKTVR